MTWCAEVSDLARSTREEQRMAVPVPGWRRVVRAGSLGVGSAAVTPRPLISVER